MLAGIHRLATGVWTSLAAGAGAGFLARDALGLRQPLVAVAWTVGAVLPLLALRGPRAKRPNGERGRTGGERGRPGGERGRPGGERGGPGGERGRPGGERGQATLELTALVLLVALALGALVAVAHRFDGRSFGGFLAFHIVCTMGRDCHDRDSALTRAYTDRDAALVRELAPSLVYEGGERQLPVDWRDCRRPACAEAPDEADLDVHRTDAGERATAFTRLLRRGRRTYLQYWLYYPDSKSVWAGSDTLWETAWQGVRLLGLVRRPPRYPGTHDDDWEAYAVRLDPDGRAWARASSHRGWQGCKEHRCRNRWTPRTGWTRVSRGSHAGHIPLRHELRGDPRWVHPRQFRRPGAPHPRLHPVPLLPGHDLEERTTTGEGLRLVPLETLEARDYRPNDEDVRPPWRKQAYWDPESDES